ncbi:[Fructose-bisphosphate aldolase]-lysine N-methyltransferase [Durusdinium trenchii]|uniref:Chloroplastic n=1 Tax=Durusdinium trenchii TaxID=1381693 RepID=A0ABP0IVQ9_9DINO
MAWQSIPLHEASAAICARQPEQCSAVLSPAPTPEVVVPVSKASTKPTKPVPSQTSHSLQELRHKSVTDLREMLASRGVSEGSARDKADLAEWVWQHQDLPVLSSWRQKRGPKGPRRYGYGIGGEGRTADEAESEPEAPKLEANDAKQIDGDDVKLLEGEKGGGHGKCLSSTCRACEGDALWKQERFIHARPKLLAWLEEGGAQGLSDVELIESEVFGRGFLNCTRLVACRDFSQHEIVVSIPTSLCLAGADELGPEEKAAAALLKEKHLGQKSRFQLTDFEAYIASLTPLSMRMHPATWPKHLKWKRLFASSPGALRRIRRARTVQIRGSA